MNERDIQEILTTLFDTLIDAKDDVAEDDDELPDITVLADTLVEMVSTCQPVQRAIAYAKASPTSGLLLRTDDGSEFQITIVQSRQPA